MRNFVAVGSWVSILWGVKIRHLPLTWPVAVNTVLALPRSLWLKSWKDPRDPSSHNFIHLLKRQHNYAQKNETENLTNQQHKTLKRYFAQSTQWRHTMFSEAENFWRNLHFLLLIAANFQWPWTNHNNHTLTSHMVFYGRLPYTCHCLSHIVTIGIILSTRT